MENYTLDGQLIYIDVWKYLNANMYIMLEGGSALIIDPHYSKEAEDLLNSRYINDVKVLLTHGHFDHTEGINWLKTTFNTEIICHENCSKTMMQNSELGPGLISFVLSTEHDGQVKLESFNKEFKPCKYAGDIIFTGDFIYKWKEYSFKFENFPGHSQGSCLIFLNNKYVFTGDTILKNLPVLTHFPGGNCKIFKQDTLPRLENLDPNLMVFPGHGKYFPLSDIFNNNHITIRVR